MVTSFQVHRHAIAFAAHCHQIHVDCRSQRIDLIFRKRKFPCLGPVPDAAPTQKFAVPLRVRVLGQWPRDTATYDKGDGTSIIVKWLSAGKTGWVLGLARLTQFTHDQTCASIAEHHRGRIRVARVYLGHCRHITHA
jgi:hypothetical protein